MAKQEFTSEALEAIVQRLRGQAAEINAIAKAFQLEGVGSLPIDNHRMLFRSLTSIDNFRASAERSLRQFRDRQLLDPKPSKPKRRAR